LAFAKSPLAEAAVSDVLERFPSGPAAVAGEGLPREGGLKREGGSAAAALPLSLPGEAPDGCGAQDRVGPCEGSAEVQAWPAAQWTAQLATADDEGDGGLAVKAKTDARTDGEKPVSGDDTVDVHRVVVDENRLLPKKQRLWSLNVARMRDLVGLEEVRTLSSSRFGSVKLMKRSIENGFEYFAAKFYNVGDNREGLQSFIDRVNPIVSLSHPHVMPIVGVIEPAKTRGPIIITRYSEIGSLADVLDRVCRHDPPRLWGNSTKLGIIVGLVSGFLYLHSHGVIHRELKPSDLIVESDGSIRICGYLTRILEDGGYTRASANAALLYVDPGQSDTGSGESQCVIRRLVFSPSL
jgi:hypothetical protein